MQYRVFPRTGWQVAEIGYGTWGMAGWTGSDDAESLQAMERAIALGCNFFDTALGLRRRATASGCSRQAAEEPARRARLRRDQGAAEERPVAGAADYPLDDVFPPDHIREMTEKSLENLGARLRRPAAVPRVDATRGPRTSGGSARWTT